MENKSPLLIALICSAGLSAQLSARQDTKQKKLAKKTAPEKVVAVKIPDDAYLIDTIEAVVFGSEVTDIVTLSDIQRIGFDGQYHTKDDVIAQRVMFQDALKSRIAMDEKAVDEYIAKISKSTGSSIDDIKAMFSQAGYTYEEGRRQFAIMYANNQLIDFKIRSRLVVPERLVVEYYEAHPVVRPATFVLDRAFVPTSPQTHDEVKKRIAQFRKTGKGLVVMWHQLPEITYDDLAENKQFIADLSLGEVSEPQEVEGGFELFRMKSKKPEQKVSLEERYREISEQIRRPKYEEMLADYKKELLKDASILYL